MWRWVSSDSAFPYLVVRLLEIGKLAISAMLDSQPSLGSGRASHPNCMINRTAPEELEEIIRQFMLPEPLPHPLISTRLLIGRPGFG